MSVSSTTDPFTMVPTSERWITEVPSQWDMRRLKTLFRERSVKGYPDLPLLAATQAKGVVTKETYGLRTVIAQSGLENLKLVEPGDFVISLRSFEGGIEVSHARGIISPAYTVLRIQDQSLHGYFVRLFKSRYFLDAIRLSVTGIREGQNVDYARLGRSLVTVPTPASCRAIVRYLDHAELRIAKAIAAKQDVVRLLKEQKAVVESRALFGGGWTTGVEKWFGEVPAGWEVLPSRALFAERIERNHGDLEMLSVTMARGVVRQSSYLKSDGSKKDQAREDRSQYKAVEPDDLVYNKMRAWQGAAGKSEFRGIVSPAYVVLRPLSGANSDYYGMMLRSRQFAREAERHSYGITSDMWSLRPQHFKLIEFPSPPLAEQAAIVNLCKAQTEKIDLAIEAIEAEITLLKEYRTRLISDVVTGKLDVRDEAAKLSDIDPMELATVAVDENGDEEEATDDD